MDLYEIGPIILTNARARNIFIKLSFFNKFILCSILLIYTIFLSMPIKLTVDSNKSHKVTKIIWYIPFNVVQNQLTKILTPNVSIPDIFTDV